MSAFKIYLIFEIIIIEFNINNDPTLLLRCKLILTLFYLLSWSILTILRQQ